MGNITRKTNLLYRKTGTDAGEQSLPSYLPASFLLLKYRPRTGISLLN